MTTLASLMLERVLLLDGGMGTQILARKPSVDDFGGNGQILLPARGNFGGPSNPPRTESNP